MFKDTPPPYTPSTEAWPTNAFDEVAAIERRASHVLRLARAASALHQDGLADELFAIADDISGASSSLRDLVGEVCSDRYMDAQQATANMLGVALAFAKRD